MTGNDDDYVNDYSEPINDKYDGPYYPKGPHNLVYCDSDNDCTKQDQTEFGDLTVPTGKPRSPSNGPT
jgi:hypothetical protein